MKSLGLQKLYLCSDNEKAARIVQFDPTKNVVLGENDTGKSSLIKSIYAVFGADPSKTNDTWTRLKANLLLEFSVNGVPYRMMRSQSFFALFNGFGQLLWNGSGVVNGAGPQIAALLDFQLRLPDRSGEQAGPPPA